MSYILYAWLTSITYGLGGVIGKVATKYHIANPWLYNFAWAVFTVVGIVPFALLYHVGMPQDWHSIVILGVANAVSAMTFTFAFYAVDLTILSPLANVRTPMSALLGVMVFGESLSVIQWFLIGALCVAGFVVYLDEHTGFKAFWEKGTLLAGIWIVTSVWFNAMIHVASAHNGFWEVSLWSNVLMVVFLLPTIPLFYRDFMKTPFKRYTGVVINTGLWTAGLLFSIKALAENVSISTAIISLPLAMIFTVGLSFVAPKLLEKHPARIYAVRLIATMVMFLAALGLSK